MIEKTLQDLCRNGNQKMKINQKFKIKTPKFRLLNKTKFNIVTPKFCHKKIKNQNNQHNNYSLVLENNELLTL